MRNAGVAQSFVLDLVRRQSAADIYTPLVKAISQSLGISLFLAATAVAGEVAVVAPSPTPEPRFKISSWIDSGTTFNPASPADNQNFGRFFDDRVNEPLLNQLVINFERALAPQRGQFDWGFKLQFMKPRPGNRA